MNPQAGPSGNGRIWIVATAFAAIGIVLLWQEHRAHLLGALPYVFLLACPLMHLFMHHGHGHGHEQGGEQPNKDGETR